MNFKKVLGYTCKAIGLPSELALWSSISCFMHPDNFPFLLVTIPLAVVTLPFYPFVKWGDDLLDQEQIKDFTEKAKNYPKINLKEHEETLRKIDIYDHPDKKVKYYISNSFMMEGDDMYDTEEEAEKVLREAGYVPAVDENFANYPKSLEIYWIKQ